MPSLTFVVSTGRCGTQWLATALREVFGDVAVVTHEPIDARYSSSRFHRRLDSPGDVAESPVVREHVARVDAVARHRDYIETGWTAYAALPYYMERYQGRVRLLHVVRNPVATAVSMAHNGLYTAEQREAGNTFATDAVLEPTSPGVRLAGFSDRWAAMDEFEKCLFWWAEINLFAGELAERYPAVPFHRTRFEEMFDPAMPALQELVAFLGLPWRPGMDELRGSVVDENSLRRAQTFDQGRVERHPEVLELAASYGYVAGDSQVQQSGPRPQRHEAIAVPRPGGAAVVRGVAERTVRAAVRSAKRLPAVRSGHRALKLMPHVVPGPAFVVREVVGAGAPATYSVRSIGGHIRVRHTAGDAAAVEDIARRTSYDVPAEVLRNLERLGRAPVIVDLGAGPGVAALRLTGQVAGAVLRAFEPDPAAIEVLRWNLEANLPRERWTLVEQPDLAGADLARINLAGEEWHILTADGFAEAGPPALVIDFDNRRRPAGTTSELSYILEDAGYNTLPAVGRGDGSGTMWAWLGAAAWPGRAPARTA